MSRQRAPQRPTERTREILISATRRLLATTPAPAITIRGIGEEAGVQFSLVTRHFGSKDALLIAAYQQIVADWVAAIVDGPVDELVDRAAEYLASHPFDLQGIRFITAPTDVFPDGRSPVVDAIVEQFDQGGRPVDTVDVTAAVALLLGWLPAKDHWSDAAGADPDEALAAVIVHAKRCLAGPTS